MSSTRPPSAPPLAAVDAVRAIARFLERASRRLAPQPIPLLEIVAGHWRPHALGVMARLGIADLLAEGSRDVGELAQATGVDEDALFRVLRALAADGFFERTADRRFALNELVQPLRTDHPQSIRNTVLQITSEWSTTTWSHLHEAVRDGSPTFAKLHGKPLWDWFDDHPEAGKEFHASMAELSALDIAPVAAGYDFSRHRRIVDLGGGSGQLLAGLLSAWPHLTGAVYDTPQVAGAAAARFVAAGLDARASVVFGSFFESVPQGFDLYVMRQVVHGHRDDELAPMLRRVRASMTPEARLLVLDTLVPELDERAPHPGFLDLQMLVGSGGRERTRREMEALLDGAGLRLVDVRRTASPTAIFVAEPR